MVVFNVKCNAQRHLAVTGYNLRDRFEEAEDLSLERLACIFLCIYNPNSQQEGIIEP